MITPLNQFIGERIKTYRLMRNYSQEYLASKVGVSQNTLSKVEQGSTPVTIDRLLDIAAILDINIIAFITNPVAVTQ